MAQRALSTGFPHPLPVTNRRYSEKAQRGVNKRNALCHHVLLRLLPVTIPGMDTQKFVSLHELSRRLGLPAAWLRDEAATGRIPSLRAGRRLMFRVDDVERTLADRAKAGVNRG